MGAVTEQNQLRAETGAAQLTDRAERIGAELSQSLRGVIEALPGSPRTPTQLAARLGMNRVIVSRIVNAVARPHAFEFLHRVPGPESLRVLSEGAQRLGVDAAKVAALSGAIDRFAALIRDGFGTRTALNAALNPHDDDLRRRFEHSSRYDIFRGMRQVVGAEAQTWLTSMIFVPAPDGEDRVEITTVHGGLGLRRLRPGVDLYFTFGAPYKTPDETGEPTSGGIELDEFCTHRPAPLESRVNNGLLVHRLADDSVGKQAALDMLAVSHNPRGTRRYAAPDRRLGGLAVYADMPVATMIADVLVHESLFPGAAPELIVYKPSARGPANPNDPSRDTDRLSMPERIEELGTGAGRFDVPEVPRYGQMMARVFSRMGIDESRYRLCRLRVAYPVFGFQHVIAFEAPPKPGG